MKRAPFNGWLRRGRTALKTTLAQAMPNRARGPRDQETPKSESTNDGSVVSPIGFAAFLAENQSAMFASCMNILSGSAFLVVPAGRVSRLGG